MSNDEGKFLLHAYRPGGQDADDPAMRAALAQASADPALGAWFERQRAHDAAIAAKLRTIAPPPGLREAILAGGDATQRAAVRRGWGWRTWGALAAGVIVLIAASIFLWPANPSDPMVAFAFEDVAHGRHGGHGAPAAALQSRLANAHLVEGLPIDFSALERTGCRTLSVAGHDVLEVCFSRGTAEFHCYVGRAREFPMPGTPGGPEFTEHAKFAAATWTKGDYRWVVVGDSGLEALKQLL